MWKLRKITKKVQNLIIIVYCKVFYEKGTFEMSKLDDLEDQKIPGTNNNIKIIFSEENKIANKETDTWSFKENDPIVYNKNYNEHIVKFFKFKQGDTALTYTDEEAIKKQRGILQYILKRIGTNLLSGTGIMNISLPIRIFDERSLLEVFACQLALSPDFLEKAGSIDDPLEKMKLVH